MYFSVSLINPHPDVEGGGGGDVALIMYADAFEEVSRTVGDVAPRLER